MHIKGEVYALWEKKKKTQNVDTQKEKKTSQESSQKEIAIVIKATLA